MIDPSIDVRAETGLASQRATPAPTWLAASVAVTVALLLGVSLAVRPATAVAHGAVGGDGAAEAAALGPTPAHRDLFELPAWKEDATTPAAVR